MRYRGDTLAARFAPNHTQLHVLDLDAHEQEVDLAADHILQMVHASVVLELDVQTILDADLQLDSGIDRGWDAQALHPHILLLRQRWQELAFHDDLDEVPNAGVASVVALVLLVHVTEEEGNFDRRLVHHARWRQLLGQRNKVMVGSPLVHSVSHLDTTDELNSDPQMLRLLSRRAVDGDDAADVLRSFVGDLLMFNGLRLRDHLSRVRVHHGGRSSDGWRAFDSTVGMLDTPEWIPVQLPAGIVVHRDALLILLLRQLDADLESPAAGDGIDEASHVHLGSISA
mmetsp:Transcript_20253/g.56432  ORF Transcript_20253/g.56432 Transcript_20253/m.56432 type:complete len:285 (+) Transcript_20253:549-1403(+)